MRGGLPRTRAAAAVAAAVAAIAVVIAIGGASAHAAAGRGRAPAPRRWQSRTGKPNVTVVYLHGWGDRPGSRLARVLLDELQARGESLQAIAPWLRPARWSDRGTVEPSGFHLMSTTLDRAREVIRAHPGPVVLVGHSFGGKAAVKLAEEFDHVVGVVALAPAFGMLRGYWQDLTGEAELPPAEVVRARLAQHHTDLIRQLRATPRSRREEREHLSAQFARLRVMEDLVAYDEPAVETRARKPVLVLHGTDDDIVPIDRARRFAQDNPGVEMVELGGLDHMFVPSEKEAPAGAPARPENPTGALADAVQAFLRRVAPAPAARTPRRRPRRRPARPARIRRVTTQHATTPTGGQFSVREGAHSVGVLTYVREGNRARLTHTYTDPAWRGRGIAAKLVEEVVAWARREGVVLVPECSYTVAAFERNERYADVLAR